MGTLFLVATPIGNLGDITMRALEVLKDVDTIACEDTRHTLKLLTHFGIRKSLISCHANDEERGVARILGILSEGRKVAFCSDAGTPGISDPGTRLAASARASGHVVTPIPGACAFATLVSAAGIGGRSYLFDGFPSPKSGKRRSRVAELMEREESFVLYESPHRLARLLSDIASVDPARRICVGREMTKIHEEFVSGSAAEVCSIFQAQETIRGECAVLVAGPEVS